MCIYVNWNVGAFLMRIIRMTEKAELSRELHEDSFRNYLPTLTNLSVKSYQRRVCGASTL